MKTLKYILVPALTGLLFAACNTEPKGPSQAELDTQVEAKVKAATDQLKTDCDSRLMQAAQMQADSIIAKTAKQTVPVKKVVPPAPPAPPKTKVVKTPPVKTTPKPPSNTTRPGSNQANVPANNHSRPGSNEAAQQQEKPASNKSRPGANK